MPGHIGTSIPLNTRKVQSGNQSDAMDPTQIAQARARIASTGRGRFGSGAARLAAIPAGLSPANTRSPVHVVVIPSGREGDQTAGSLEVKARRSRSALSRVHHSKPSMA